LVPYHDQSAEPTTNGYVEAALLPGDQVVVEAFLRASPSGGARWCLQWSAERGERSALITAEIQENGRWVQIIPETFCVANKPARITMYNSSSEPQFVAFNLRRILQGTAGYSTTAERNMEKVSDYPTKGETIRDGLRYLFFAALAAVVTLLASIPFSTVFDTTYQIARRLLPSAKASTVRDEVHRAAYGSDFDAHKTHVYDDNAANRFRQKQEADDMRDITASIKQKTQDLQEKEIAEEQRARERIEREERATREYEESVERLKAAQERYENERGK
jgi:hypothetical protein